MKDGFRGLLAGFWDRAAGAKPMKRAAIGNCTKRLVCQNFGAIFPGGLSSGGRQAIAQQR